MRKQLFDRFESNKELDVSDLARDIADILGARRALSGHRLPGVLTWGLPPSTTTLSPQVFADREKVAGYMKAALISFEPRLENIEVIPTEGSNDFSFELHGNIIDDDGDTVTLRIITPRRGGGLGAEVVVISSEGGKVAFIKGEADNLVDDS